MMRFCNYNLPFSCSPMVSKLFALISGLMFSNFVRYFIWFAIKKKLMPCCFKCNHKCTFDDYQKSMEYSLTVKL